MPKMKTHKSASKRVWQTAGGKLMSRNMSAQHRARFKSKRALDNSTGTKQVVTNIAKKMIRSVINTNR